MATAAELARPGVEVYQKVRAKSPTFLKPTLAPVVVGPAFEVVDVLTSDGTPNPKAKYGAYAQLAKVITQSAFPDSRGNIDELVIQLDTVKPFLQSGGLLPELPMDPGESFLNASHVSTKARLTVSNGNSYAIQGKALVLAVDQPKRLDFSKDVTVTFSGSSPLTAQQVVDAINSAFGMAIAALTVDGGGAPNGLTLSSPIYGALASLTVRGGSSDVMTAFGWANPTQEKRIEGAGYRAFNLGNNSTVSTFVEFFQGDYLADGTSVGAGAWPAYATHITVITGAVQTARAAALDFTASSLPLRAGDQMIADGVRVEGGDVTYTESGKFRLGTVNAQLSTADEAGNYISKVYDDVKLGITTLDNEPWAPAYVWFKAAGLKPTVSAVKATLTMTQTATAPGAAKVTGSVLNFGSPIALGGLTIDYVVTVDGVDTVGTFTFTGGPYASMAALLAAISIPGLTPTNSAGALALSTTKTGLKQGVSVLATGSANTALGFSTSSPTSDVGEDAAVAGLPGTSLKFKLDHGAHEYQAPFVTTSLDDAVAAVNAVVGATVAAKDGNGTKMVLTSQLAGAGSYLLITGANTQLGFANAAVNAGSARPNPDAYIDGTGNLVIGPDLIRDPVTGYPMDQATSPATLFIQYVALRQDVSPVAKQAGVLRIPDVDTLGSVLDPIDTTNPLALGCYLAMLNAPNFEVKALGVDEVTGAAPEGSELAYARAAAMLESEEVYAIAPLTQNEVVHGLFNTHVTLMSEPEQGGERILFFNKKTPVTKTPAVAASGTGLAVTATPNQVVLDVTPQAGLIAAGLNPANPLAVSDGVYVEFSWQGVFYRYNVSSVTGGLANLNLVFGSGQNDDLFYTTAALPSGIVDAAWSMKVRGASLTIPGSNPARMDWSLVAATVSEGNAGYGNRRAYSLFPDQVKTTLQGVDRVVPGYYACAAVAGMVAGLPPAQGHTNYPITGLTGAPGTEKFTRKQLNVMAGGGTYILMQEVQGGPVFSRHQLSTDTTSVETRELSITKVVDFTAKFLRAGVRRFIGRQNINAVFLDTVGTTITGMLQFLVDNGVLNGFNLNNIIQDEKNPDTVLLDVTLDVPYPCNYIKLTLVV
jgi:hypothetical protein